MRSRIFVKLMFVFLLVICVTAITLQLTVHKVWERTLREQIERNLKQKTLMFAYRVEADRQHSLADITSQEGQAAGSPVSHRANQALSRDAWLKSRPSHPAICAKRSTTTTD